MSCGTVTGPLVAVVGKAPTSAVAVSGPAESAITLRAGAPAVLMAFSSELGADSAGL